MAAFATSRRHFLVGAGAAGGGLLIGNYGRARSPSHGTPFTLGVASGDPSPDGFVVWTRLAPDPRAPDGSGGLSDPVQVHWEIAADDTMRRIVQSGTVEANRCFVHAVHIEVGGLAPNRPYWYRFTALGEQSPIGRSRTLPLSDDPTAHLHFAFASCSHWEFGYFSAYRHMAAENPDLVLFLGDYIYELTAPDEHAGLIVRRHGAPTAVSLADYRNRYALYRTDPDLQALHASAPCLVTWDDHEVANDYADQWSMHMDTSPEEFLRQRTAAYRAYYEHMPLRARAMPRGSSLQLYQQVRIGRLATFTVLDTRQYRSKQPCEVPPSRRGHVASDSCTERLNPTRSLLGHAQEQWLFDGFKNCDTTWNVLAQSQLVAQFRQRDAAGAIGHWTEGWDGYPASRQRVLEAISDMRVSNPVFIGGDIHSFWATDLKANFNNPSSQTVATEFVCTSITSDGPPYQRFAEMLPENPHVHFFDSRPRGYVSADITPERAEMRFQTISDRRDPDAKVSTLKRFVVEKNKPEATPD
ncbi:alkaline phosphatase D family protein [Nitrobacter sp. TKz-YC02]|uniref:alkaline phosphatase D family protein n=1 Tax=Nitrobacter sp. TKz-YC02 TaxID=3398704 RepID=UPI003CF43028